MTTHDKNDNTSFSQTLLHWYDQHGRHDLPWQHPRSLYRVWVSEIMLQQTQVATVIPYFERFLNAFPDIDALARASEDEVLHLWSGLGYYARARNLHKAARLIRDEYASEFPQDVEQVLALPGIGRSTAAAILAQALGQCHAILDGNVKRVLTRFFAIEGWPGQKSVENRLWELSETLTPRERLADYTQAIMDLGATLCSRGKPQCTHCPFTGTCAAHLNGNPEQLPTPRPRKTLPVKQTRMVILTNHDGHVMLQKRPPAGIWGGLWSLPEVPEHFEPETYCQQQLGLNIEKLENQSVLRHTFSHYHLDITPICARVKSRKNAVMESDTGVWYNSRQPDRRGLPAPVKQLLARYAGDNGNNK